jgi:hypothetical protein
VKFLADMGISPKRSVWLKRSLEYMEMADEIIEELL